LSREFVKRIGELASKEIRIAVATVANTEGSTSSKGELVAS